MARQTDRYMQTSVHTLAAPFQTVTDLSPSPFAPTYVNGQTVRCVHTLAAALRTLMDLSPSPLRTHL